MAVSKKNSPVSKTSGKLSLVIPCYNEEQRITQMIAGLEEFAKKSVLEYEIIVVDDGSTDETVAAIESNEFIKSQVIAEKFKLIKLNQNHGKGAALKAGVAAASGTHILTLDADMSARPVEVEKWLALNNHKLPDREIWIASREHHDSKITEVSSRRWTGRGFNFCVRLLTPLRHRDTQCGFKLYPTEIAKKLFEKQRSTGWAHDVEILYRAEQNGITVKDLPVKWEAQAGSKISPLKDSLPMFLSVLGVSLRLKWEYFVSTPIALLTKKESYTSLGNEDRGDAIFRMLFFFGAIFLFFLMTTASFQYGITGDDLDQKIYGEKVLSYYLTLGKDTSCLHLKVGNKQNLELYGGLFNMIPAAASRIMPSVDAFDMRHLFDSIAGFLAILFAGLLARKLGGWRTGFLALALLATWPQFFGQSMNNPKDIPFAFAYIFAIYYLMKLLMEFPRPSTRTLILSTVGIALAINMRVGGLLLIGMMFAFIIGNYILSKSFRESFAADKNSVSRTITYLVVISITGYFGGLLFWPYGIMAPLSNPFIALKEMANFSVNIRLLFDGQHIFSNEIPWYYIPEWLWVITPLVVLFAFILLPFLLFFLRKYFNINYLLLILFATIFPWAYAAYNKSPLYDGMRQMLFITPTIAVLAAITWDYFFKIAKSKVIRIAVSVLLIIGIALPVRFSFANHPNEYVYFNELIGGIKGAYGNFDTDYYMNSIRKDCEWMKKNIPPENGKKIIIGTNTADPVNWYFRNDTAHFKVAYVRFSERSQKDWDYGIFFSRSLDRSQIINNSWLGSQPLYTERADGIPLSVVIPRKDKSDFFGEQALDKNEFEKADSLFSLAVKYEPKNEEAWVSLGRSQLQEQKFKEAISSLQQSLQIYPDNDNALTMLGVADAQTGDFESAIGYLNQSLKQNPNNPQAYYYLGLIYQQKGDKETAQRYFDVVKQFQHQGQ